LLRGHGSWPDRSQAAPLSGLPRAWSEERSGYVAGPLQPTNRCAAAPSCLWKRARLQPRLSTLRHPIFYSTLRPRHRRPPSTRNTAGELTHNI
jgi:hypothetical protein